MGLGKADNSRWDNQPNQSLLKDGYLEDYKPETGDVVIMQPFVGGRPEGHMAMYDGSVWISDFKQRGIWPGTGYRLYKPNYVIYRYKKQIQ